MKRAILAASVFLSWVQAAGAAGPRVTTQETVETVREVIRPEAMRPEHGFCHTATLRLGRAGDKDGRSLCVLLEDGKPLGPPRALHADIRAQGMGRYSHWTPEALYFSASDNSDPRSNGREYELASRRRIARKTFTCEASAPETAYRVEAAADREIANHRLVVRNLDARAAVVPHLKIEGWPDLSSAEGMLGSILSAGMSDEQKAAAIWKFLVDWRYHYYPSEGNDEVHDPVKFINVYGYGFCDDSAQNFAALCRAAGLQARIWGLDGHVVGEAFYGGGWHMFDPDHEVYYRMPGGSVACVEELAAHPELITATPKDPIGSDSASIANLYTTTDNNHPEERIVPGGWRLDPQLLPGDEVIFDLKEHKAARRVAFADQPLPPVLGNGRLVRRLDFSDAGGTVEIRVEWPYVLLGGELRLDLAQADASIGAEIIEPGDRRTPLAADVRGNTWTADLGGWLRSRKPAPYACALRITSGAAKELKQLARSGSLAVEFQFAPRALPQVRPGGTAFLLRLAAPGGTPLPRDCRGVEIVHEWDEIIEALPAE